MSTSLRVALGLLLVSLALILVNHPLLRLEGRPAGMGWRISRRGSVACESNRTRAGALRTTEIRMTVDARRHISNSISDSLSRRSRLGWLGFFGVIGGLSLDVVVHSPDPRWAGAISLLSGLIAGASIVALQSGLVPELLSYLSPAREPPPAGVSPRAEVGSASLRALENSMTQTVPTAAGRQAVMDESRERPGTQPAADFAPAAEARHMADSATLREVERAADRLHARLSAEIDALAQRGTVNLITGLSLAAGGFAALIWMLPHMPGRIDPARAQEVALTQAVRLALVVLMEAFAFFFLRLYRRSLDGIKYLHDELTDFQHRELALRAALITRNAQAVNRVIDELLRRERNLVITRGETMVELERVSSRGGPRRWLMRMPA